MIKAFFAFNIFCAVFQVSGKNYFIKIADEGLYNFGCSKGPCQISGTRRFTSKKNNDYELIVTAQDNDFWVLTVGDNPTITIEAELKKNNKKIHSEELHYE